MDARDRVAIAASHWQTPHRHAERPRPIPAHGPGKCQQSILGTRPPIPTDLRLEQGTALSHLWDAADGMRQTAGDLLRAVEAHAMISFAYLRAVADGQRPDPSDLLRSRGRLDALLSQLQDRADFEADQLSELRFGMLDHDDGDPDLEAQAMASFRERFRLRSDRWGGRRRGWRAGRGRASARGPAAERAGRASATGDGAGTSGCGGRGSGAGAVGRAPQAPGGGIGTGASRT